MTRSRAWREGLASALVQLAVLAAFFWTPLSRFGEVHYSAADLTQGMSLTRIEPGHRSGNQLQSDAVTQMQPWVLFNRAELAAGRFPLWNPYNGAGAPHFANFQSAVVSPFSVPFYVLDFKTALLASAALKLLALGLFTYLFLREIGCSWLAATTGAIAFQFAGHNALLLYFPHVGAMFALPAGLFFVERALRRAEEALIAGRRARLFAPLAGLVVALVVGLLAGNPEPFFFACWGIGAWIVARLVGLWRAHGRLRAGTALPGLILVERERRALAQRELARTVAKITLACVLPLGLTAFQVLPFLDYLDASRVLEQRSLRQTPLDLRWWPLHLFPDVLGSPAGSYRISETIPPPNYELVNMSYVGGAVLMLALACPFVARRRAGRWFFPILALVWFVYAHDVLGAYDLFVFLPALDIAPMNRSQGLWNFALACAAAIALDGFLGRTGPRAWFAAGWWVVAGAVTVVVCLIGADRLIDAYADLPSPFHRWFVRAVPPHITAMAAWTLVAVGATAAMLVMRHRAVRTLLGVAVAAAVFAQTGWLLRDYNPVSPDPFVFPRTDRIESLQRIVGRERLAILGNDGLPPDSNMVYGLSQLASYDGMWVRDLDALYRDQFGEGNNWRPILRGSHRALRLFGTRWVLAKWDWNFLDNGLRDYGKNLALQPLRVELLPDRTAVQTFQCYETELSAVMVVLSTPRNVRDCTLRFRLEEEESGVLVSEQTLSSRAVQSTVYSELHPVFPGEWQLNPAGRPVVFRFEPQPRSSFRRYRLVLSCDDGRAADTIYAWRMPVLGYGPGQAAYAGRPLTGELLFDWTCGEANRFEEAARIGDYTLFRLRDPVPVYSLSDGSVTAKADADALDILRSPTFDPRRLVVLGNPDEAARRAATEAASAARQRRIVQFSDSPYCYLVGADGKTLAHIDDEATFLANRFEWSQIEKLQAEERAAFVLVPDTDLAGKRAVGLRLVSAPAAGAPAPEVLEETPTYVRLRVSRQRPGFLLAANAYDPGWKATIGGEETPVFRANYAFQAVEIPPGSWEVELRYRPDSLIRGAWIGAGSLLVAAAAGLASWRGRRRYRPRAGTGAPSPDRAPLDYAS